MKDLRVTITVRNNLLMRAIEGAGFDSVPEFCRANRLSYHQVNLFLSLKLAPIHSGGEWRQQAIKLADALRAMPEDLFPAAFLRRAMERNKVEREISSDDVPALGFGGVQSIAYDPEASAMKAEALAAMHDALGTLTPRERAVLNAVYGLDGSPPKTLREAGSTLGVGNVTQERVRQIQLRAERRLKGGTRGEKMKAARQLLEHTA